VRNIELRRKRRAHASIVLRDGPCLVVGGEGDNSMERIDPVAGVSQLLSPTLPTALDDHRLAMLPDGRVWILAAKTVKRRHDGSHLGRGIVDPPSGRSKTAEAWA